MIVHLYIVRSRDGKFLRRKGYGGYGEKWVEDLADARMYSRIGPARAQVTWWTKHYPEFGTPEILILEARIVGKEEQEARVEKAIASEKEAVRRSEIAQAKRKIKEAERRYAELRGQL
jgi:hypothetical protein